MKKLLIFLTVPLLLVLNGCTHYSPKSLKRVKTKNIEKQKTTDITFAYEIFDQYDCQIYLDRNVIAAGYQPIHITLTNNTANTIEFSTLMFSLPCASIQEVAESVHTNTTRKALGYGVAGIFIWPLWIPAIVEGHGSAKANKLLDNDFERKGLHHQLIAPSQTIDGLIFIPVESFSPHFTFIVTDITTKKQYTLSS